jgi:hypothetical protein
VLEAPALMVDNHLVPLEYLVRAITVAVELAQVQVDQVAVAVALEQMVAQVQLAIQLVQEAQDYNIILLEQIYTMQVEVVVVHTAVMVELAAQVAVVQEVPHPGELLLLQ